MLGGQPIDETIWIAIDYQLVNPTTGYNYDDILLMLYVVITPYPCTVLTIEAYTHADILYTAGQG